LIINVLRFKYFSVLKKYSTNKILAFGIILIFMISTLSAAYPQTPTTNGNPGKAIVWDVALQFDEPGAAYDYSIFGEAPDANDGPPADAYDTVKPPAPMPSYIRAWFNDNLPFPYNNLWKDYRHYPAMSKTWNLSVQWVPEDSESPTTITISWNSGEINTTEYASITLYTSTGTPLKNMLLYSSYSFVCPAFLPQTFKIICVANQAPNIPSNPSPANGSIEVPVNTDLSWTCNDPNGDPLTYDVYFGTSSSPPKVASNISTATYDPGTMTPGTLLYWKIVAWDIYSANTTSPLWHFQTNSLPNQPSNPNPSNGSTGISINALLSWSCSDPDGDPLTYDVYFGTNSSPPKVLSNISTTTYSPSMNYSTLYYWKIVAWDTNSGPRAGSIWHFQTNSLPNQPSNPNPSNGSTDVPINTDLSWSGGDPDPGDTVTYDVYFGTSSNPPHVAYNQSALIYDPGTLAYNTLYYWKIVAWDNHDASLAGPLWHFATGTQPNQPPNIPSNPSPANGSTGVSVNADLSWQGGDPDPGDTVTYDVYFGKSSSPPIVSYHQSSLSYDPGTLASYTYYYWKIVAWDNHGANTTGPLWQFRTAYVNNPPYAPSNPSPANGATGVPVNSDLSWTGGDPDSGDFVTYDVYFGSSYPLTKIKSNTSGTSCALENLDYSAKYYWKVVAWDNHQNTNASPVWSFTTKLDTSGPSLAITSPKKGWLYVNLLVIQRKFPIFITTLVIGQIEVAVTASDSQSGMNRVEFYLDDDLKATDYTAPYSWSWVEHGYFFPFPPYQLTVKAYDNIENPSTLSYRVWKIL
jgi:hypothetical protein